MVCSRPIQAALEDAEPASSGHLSHLDQAGQRSTFGLSLTRSKQRCGDLTIEEAEAFDICSSATGNMILRNLKTLLSLAAEDSGRAS